MVRKAKIGNKLWGKEVLDVVTLSNGWQVAKTEDTKSSQDFRVKIVSPRHPRGFTIKHAHFAIDFYGKLCQDRKKALKILEALEKVWHGRNVNKVLEKYESRARGSAGYSLEYYLYALRWILDQEDINFRGRSSNKQEELDEKLQKQGIKTPSRRAGSQLAIALFCDIASGVHPVEAFYSAGLSI